jgi:hypothetical protein
MVDEHHFSERRACRLVGLSRDAYRHPRKRGLTALWHGDGVVSKIG